MSSKIAHNVNRYPPLLDHIDERRVALSADLDPRKRKDLGQFLTPTEVASFMASMIASTSKTHLRILDPGAGIGALSVAAIDELCTRRMRPASIEFTAVELDSALCGELRHTLAAAARHCAAASIKLRSDIVETDFIDYACAALADRSELNPVAISRFDVVILNPPYRKIRTLSHERRLLQQLGIDATNLYSAFLALSAMLLAPGGELIAITPRSFCNGRYFLNFRKQFTANVSFRRVHVIESRKEAFGDDGVLQENIIFHATHTKPPASVVVTSGSVSSEGTSLGRTVPYEQLLSPADPDLFIHLPHDPRADEVAQFIRALPCRLSDLDLAVSTGRVVDFRSSDYLRATPAPDTVPLLYPTHLRAGFVTWPKAGKKPNALVVASDTSALLVPPGDYVLVKRFSAKEETRRVVAAICRPEDLPPSCGYAFENHLNYYHRNNQPLDRELATGLAAYLNSRVVDDYFRQFSGHTQVNAGDLRKLHYPSEAVLRELGRLMLDLAPNESYVDEILGAPQGADR